MKTKKNHHISQYIQLLIWIVTLEFIGFQIGTLTKSQIKIWYNTLNRSSLTPPNYMFGIAWTILYAMIGICGWMIWKKRLYKKLNFIKLCYLIQLILNWCWTPLFFSYHLTGLSLLCLFAMSIVIAMIIYFSYEKMKIVSILMIPYLIWILFAFYLNFYVYLYN